MKRYAAHYIFLAKGKIYKQYFIELDDNSCIARVHPLEDEIAETVFHNGILFPVAKDCPLTGKEILEQLKDLQIQYPSDSVFELLDKLEIINSQQHVPVYIYQLDGIDLLSAKLSTNNSSSNSHIQRL